MGSGDSSTLMLAKKQMNNYAFEDYDNISREEQEKSSSYQFSYLKNIQTKIMNWLVAINMLKEGAIHAEDVPVMCANGVFISDLINRLEGVLNEI